MSRIALPILALSVALSSSVGATTPSGGDQTISGKQLTLTANSNAARRQLSVRSNDTAITLGGGNGSADDPTQSGGSLRIRTSAGDLFDSTYSLPPSGWKTIGAVGKNKGYRFTSKTGPIKSVVVKPGKQVMVTGKGAFLYTLSMNPNSVDAVLRTGAKRYCMQFGGTVTFTAGKRFSAKSAAAPSSCPALADWPMYGFDLKRSRFNPQQVVINGSNVSRLNVRWFFSTGSGTAAVSASPSVVDGVVYVGSWNGNMYALDAFSGQPQWTFNINDPNPGGRGGFPGIQSSAAVTDASTSLPVRRPTFTRQG